MTLSDLSLTAIEWAIEQHAQKFEVPRERWESPCDFLLHTGLLEAYLPDEEQVPRYRVSLAALLLFGKESSLARHCPAFETIVLAHNGERHYRGNITETYRQLCASRASFLPSLCTAIPTKTIRELLVNTFIHRSYRDHGPIVIRLNSSHLELESPGGLPAGLSAGSLIHCTPIYRNFLLAEGARYLGICDKIGRGIDAVYEQILSSGFGFPMFESRENCFIARISLEGSREFCEFLRRRSQALSQLDEIIVLRYLFERENASQTELSAAMQRGIQFGHRVLTEMLRKMIIEPVDGKTIYWRLTSSVRRDIEHIFEEDQYNFGFPNLFGE